MLGLQRFEKFIGSLKQPHQIPHCIKCLIIRLCGVLLLTIAGSYNSSWTVIEVIKVELTLGNDNVQALRLCMYNEITQWISDWNLIHCSWFRCCYTWIPPCIVLQGCSALESVCIMVAYWFPSLGFTALFCNLPIIPDKEKEPDIDEGDGGICKSDSV